MARLLEEIQRKANKDEIQPVSVASLPLPSDAATEATLDMIASNQTDKSQYTNILIDPSNMSAFGTLETAELHPLLQIDWVHGINVQRGTTTVANSGVADTNAGRLRLQSGTNTAGSAIYQSRKPARYRAGQGIIMRYTPIFTTGKAESTQIMGAGNAADGYFFGYNGATFGICHRISGSDTWTAQANWNGDKCNGDAGTSFTYNPLFGTPMMIKYPYLGFGNITFYMQNPNNSRWVLVHTIRYANTTTTLQLSNPSLSFYGQSINSGNNTNLIMYCGSVGVFLSGTRSFVSSPKWAMDSNKSSITTETNIITLQNCTSYNGVTNRSLIRLNSVSVSSSAANGIAVFRLKLGATLGGVPAYTAINGTLAGAGATITSGNSVTSYDVAGTTIANGLYLFGIGMDNPNTRDIDLTPFDLYVAPGEFMTVSAFSTNSSAIGCVLNWTEDI